MDAKVGIKVGEFDRGGKTRVTTVALDHDFSDCPTLTPYGIFLPQEGELFLFFVSIQIEEEALLAGSDLARGMEQKRAILLVKYY